MLYRPLSPHVHTPAPKSHLYLSCHASAPRLEKSVGVMGVSAVGTNSDMIVCLRRFGKKIGEGFSQITENRSHLSWPPPHFLFFLYQRYRTALTSGPYRLRALNLVALASTGADDSRPVPERPGLRPPT